MYTQNNKKRFIKSCDGSLFLPSLGSIAPIKNASLLTFKNRKCPLGVYGLRTVFVIQELWGFSFRWS